MQSRPHSLIPFVDFGASTVEIRDDLVAAATRVIDSGSLILGPEVESFEAEFAAFCGTRHAIGVSNGLEALSLSLRAAGVGVGDEVLVPSQTFIATWLAVSHVGATPIAVDVDPATCTLDPACIEAAVTGRTRAIIPVHLFGHPADMDPVIDVAQSHGLFVLEDAAQAQGASYKNRRIGGLGDAAAFSFYPTKNLGAFGDAGAVTTNDDALAARLRSLRNYGSSRKYRHDEIGFNARLDEMQAAMLKVRLGRLQEENTRRRAIAARYDERITGGGLWKPTEAPWAEHVYHLYVVQSDRRDALAEHLRANGVSTLVHYPTAPDDTGAYAGVLQTQTQSNGKAMADRALSLPLWPSMTDEQITRVSTLVTEFCDSSRG